MTHRTALDWYRDLCKERGHEHDDDDLRRCMLRTLGEVQQIGSERDGPEVQAT